MLAYFDFVVIRPARTTRSDYHPDLPTGSVYRPDLSPYHFEIGIQLFLARRSGPEDPRLREPDDSIRRVPASGRRPAAASLSFRVRSARFENHGSKPNQLGLLCDPA